MTIQRHDHPTTGSTNDMTKQQQDCQAASKIGRLALIDYYGKPTTIPEIDLGNRENLLQTVYSNGELLVDWDFREIRERAKANLGI